jgi:hypothetical protein
MHQIICANASIDDLVTLKYHLLYEQIKYQ